MAVCRSPAAGATYVVCGDRVKCFARPLSRSPLPARQQVRWNTSDSFAATATVTAARLICVYVCTFRNGSVTARHR